MEASDEEINEYFEEDSDITDHESDVEWCSDMNINIITCFTYYVNKLLEESSTVSWSDPMIVTVSISLR